MEQRNKSNRGVASSSFFVVFPLNGGDVPTFVSTHKSGQAPQVEMEKKTPLLTFSRIPVRPGLVVYI